MEEKKIPIQNDMERTEGKPPCTVQFAYLGGASAVYALFYTFCLYKNASGITYPFFAAGTLCYFFFCMKKCRVLSDGSRDSGTLFGSDKKGLALPVFYAVSIVLLGISVCLTDDWKLHFLSKTLLFLTALFLAVRAAYGAAGWRFGDWVRGAGRSIVEMLHYIDTPLADAGEYFSGKGQKKEKVQLKYVVLGLAAAVPLLLVILALLVSADQVFAEMVGKAAGNLKLADVFGVCLLIVFVYVIAYSFIRGLLTWRMPEQKAHEKKGEPVTAITFTALIALVYLVFCGIQIFCLFLGNMKLPADLTWSEYARQGFFQLLFVCLINLALVLVCLAAFRESRVLKAILTVISGMTYILIASSAYRMLLYIQNYYLTFLRVLVLWALAVIAVLFAGVIVSVWKEKFPLFGWCSVVVLSAYLVFAFAKPEYGIAAYNLSHVKEQTEEENGYHDYGYLHSLSADAAPALVKYGRETIWRTGIMNSYRERVLEDVREMSARSFNISLRQAEKALRTIELSAVN